MPLLEVQKLTKTFGGVTAVHDLDFEIEKGQIVGLIGPNGAGKTTVFNMITGTFRPTRGRVIFTDTDITGLKTYDIVRLGLTRSYQQTLLFGEMTVMENLLLGFHLKSGIGFCGAVLNTVSTRRKEKHLLEKATKIAHLFDLDHVLHERAQNLPHGYQKALGVGIAWAADPELLLLDEPVTGMNLEETSQMLHKIQELNAQGVTIFLVEHDMQLVMNVCERVVVLNYGRKIADGTPKEICENKEVIAAYLGAKYATEG
jgi:branched-chain amino acid transport system ATP-binding protein